MGNKNNFLDWFDTDNIDHVKAFLYLSETGIWPNNFLPKDIEMPTLWQITISSRMAKKWAEYKRDNDDLEGELDKSYLLGIISGYDDSSKMLLSTAALMFSENKDKEAKILRDWADVLKKKSDSQRKIKEEKYPNKKVIDGN